MQLLEQYIRLCTGYPHSKYGSPVDISLAEVALILCCTLRNATLTLKKMQAKGWLTWQPGRGRGNRSVLVCSIRPADLVLSIAKEAVHQGEIRTSRELISQYEADIPQLAEVYARWMSSHFGIHAANETGKIDILRLFVDRPFDGLDPIHVLLRSQTHIVKQVFDTLVRFDPIMERIEPHLVYDWETDSSRCEWTFYLRKGVLFHNGSKLRADDVCYTLNRLKKEASSHRWMMQTVESVEALGEHVVRIRLNQPNELFLDLLSKEYMAIVSRDYMEKASGSLVQMPMGTGPFRLVRNDDSMLVLEAFEPYFRGRPFIDRIEIWCVPAMQAEEKQMVMPVTEEDSRLMERDSSWKSVVRLEECFQYLSFNAAKEGPLRNDAFRRKIASLIDPQKLCEDVQGSREGLGSWGFGLAFDHHSQDWKDVTIAAQGWDSSYAGEVLKLYTYPDFDHIEDAEWIKEHCASYGIEVEIVYAGPEVLARPEVMQQADMVLDSANVDEREEASLLELCFANALSITHHMKPSVKAHVTQRIAALQQETSVHERKQKVKEIIRELVEYQVFIPLYHNRIDRLAHPRLAHVHLDAYGWIDFARLIFRQ